MCGSVKEKNMNKKSYQVAKMISFCYGHRLLHYEGKCRFLHGHNGLAEIVLKKSSLDKRGMVVDFTDVKNELGAFINEQLDHKMLLHKKDPLVPALKKAGEPFFLMDSNPTAENIAKLIFDYAKSKKFPVVAVKLWETETSYAVYEGR